MTWTEWSADSNGVTTGVLHTGDVPFLTASAGPVASAASGCKVPDYSRAIYEASGAKDFIKEQFDRWNQSREPDRNFLKWYFADWLPGVPIDEARCEAGFHCSVSGLTTHLLPIWPKFLLCARS